MHKLGDEVGLTILKATTAGTGGADFIKEILKLLSSTAYSRTLENEADESAIDYLVNAEIDPKPFSNFLYRLSMKNETKDSLSWLSTHPNSKERAEKTLAYSKGKSVKLTPILSLTSWRSLQKKLGKTEVELK